jgi:hypothetical protein
MGIGVIVVGLSAGYYLIKKAGITITSDLHIQEKNE